MDKDIKDKFESAQFGDNVYEFLTSNNKYDLNDINAKVAKLKEQGVFENINSNELVTLLRNKSKEMEKVLDDIIRDKNFKKSDINYLINNLDGLKKNGINDMWRVQKFIDNECIRLMYDYTPNRNGMLIASLKANTGKQLTYPEVTILERIKTPRIR